MNGITQIARAHGLSLKDLAEKMRISESSLKSTIGKNGNPSRKTLEKIADAIGCDVSEFFVTKNETSTIIGFVEYKGKIRKITSPEDIKALAQEME